MLSVIVVKSSESADRLVIISRMNHPRSQLSVCVCVCVYARARVVRGACFC